MKETQQDFGLVDAHAAAANAEREQERSIETSEDEARPLYAPLKWERIGGTDAMPLMMGTPVDSPAFARDSAPQPNLHAPVPPTASLPIEPKARKGIPLFSGLLKYFPDALIAVAHCSYVGNEQHHPGEPLHWDKSKSTDHYDCLLRHLVDDLTGVPVDPSPVGDVDHLAKVAWRALAGLQTALAARKSA